MKEQETGLKEGVELHGSEAFEELLNRYERVLVYAGQLQEKVRQGRLLAERTSSLEEENARLRKMVGIEESYVRLLESALQSLGVLKKDP